MIKVLEKDFLEDEFVSKQFVNNISLKEKINFEKNNIYYFGNYDPNKIKLIKEKLIRNKKNIKKAIEKNVKIIVCGNSIDIFNNNFNSKELNLFTCFNKKLFKKGLKKIKFKKNINDDFKKVDDLNKVIDTNNFRYKNLFCLSDSKIITNIIKKQSK